MDEVVRIVVAQGVLGKLQSIGEALEAAKAYSGRRVIIQIEKGIYKEKLEIAQPYLTLQGSKAEDVIITYDDYAYELMPEGDRRGTFRSYTVLIDANDFTARDITFENSSGSGDLVGQALALYIDADRATFERCRMLGCQDTVFTAPLPPKEIEKGGFKGPKEFAPRFHRQMYFKDCFISGDVDFIFGGATAYFEGCEIFSKSKNAAINGYITAASTPEDEIYGYVFRNCRFTSDCQPNSVYLGRPWRDFAKVVILESELGSHIREEGWDDWNKKHAHATIFFAEYNNYGPGADISKRVPWSKQLTKEEADTYTKRNVLGDWA
ncbi:MAG: pectin methylesterase [Clostridiales bacterium]|jgi:pectinesterase|nr:pectin methylesterase [Clostridiales bacterium]